MRRNKRTSIRTETTELLIFRSVDTFKSPSHCRNCECEVSWLSFGDVAKTNGLRVGALSILIETLRVHSKETPEGHLLICQNSLAAINNETKEIYKPLEDY